MSVSGSAELFATWAGIVIAGISLIVAAISLWKSDRAQREANAAQRRIVEIEEQREQDRVGESRRAVVRVALRRTGNAFRLCIQNVGQAEARNLKIRLDGIPASEHPVVPGGQTFPTMVGPGAEVGLLMALTWGTDAPTELTVTWDDDAGTGHSFRTTLTF